MVGDDSVVGGMLRDDSASVELIIKGVTIESSSWEGGILRDDSASVELIVKGVTIESSSWEPVKIGGEADLKSPSVEPVEVKLVEDTKDVVVDLGRFFTWERVRTGIDKL
jgi:hypothetical protein